MQTTIQFMSLMENMFQDVMHDQTQIVQIVLNEKIAKLIGIRTRKLEIQNFLLRH